MPATTFIRQGEDLEFVFDLNGREITGWIATVEVKRFPSDVALISRVIPAVGRTWPGFLTSTETAALDVSATSPYYLTGVLTNSSLNQERQIPRRFNVSTDLLLPPPPSFLLQADGVSKVLLADESGFVLLAQSGIL